MANLKEDVDVAELYGQDCLLHKDDFIKKYGVRETGLSQLEAEHRLKEFGPNTIRQAKPKRWYHYFLESLFTPFNIILLGITLLLCYTDIILPEEPSYANILVIGILVIASTLLDFFEEYRSNKAANELKELVATTCTVIRDGKEVQIQIKDATIGDIVVLSAGSMIPADLRIIESTDLYVGQSSLTGESNAVKKLVESEMQENELDNIADLDTICFMGTNVISGSAKGVIIKTADATYFGKIAHTLTTGKTEISNVCSNS